MYKTVLPLVVAVSFSLSTLADEASVKKIVEGKLGGSVSSVSRTPYLGLYELYVDGQIVYTDEKVSALVVGSLIDGKTMKNVTAERMQKLSAIKFSELPLALAVKQVRGDGKRVFATFEDPNCGYCKRLAKDLAKLDNVTIYTFLYPILSPDSLEKSNQIWCAPDRVRAWNEWMIEGKAPSGRSDCDTTAVRKTIETGRKLAINGTPTIFFADGERVPGAMPLAKIEQKLSQNAGR
ncbi:MAG TPA: DsbC family protein [Accumulibacter sp.]|uniref:DsbC family protein n=2 Tax=Accumulibacter sp. TaxID=2053492 RepID=UPI0028797AC1|nr:DsbC family protein [Accumulibacter sp.]MDS4056301.1 DsbC family protein [Accumulibacter sp.]HMW63142.1 DsbC family protein [Accumulibacter sp.]HMW78856.1 DsbC family protein [Accumulibacter sp.]HMX67905.1 DsbC family protein [Accumulibacter sp.]HNB66434.1 DsbC family protein [Accumulibacter sp.]